MDDARFETLVVKQTKQSVLDDARLRANGIWFAFLTLHGCFCMIYVVVDSSVDPNIEFEDRNDEKAEPAENGK